MIEGTLQQSLAEWQALPATRAAAKAVGSNRFFTGRTCINGHTVPRKTSDKRCLLCAKAAIHQWRQANAARVNARTAARQTEETKRRSTENARKRYQADPAKAAGNSLKFQRIRRARQHNSDGFFDLQDLCRIRAWQRDRCAICRKNLRGKGAADHIYPISKGGSNWPRNIQLLCKPCNSSKRDKDPLVHMRSLGFLL